MEIIAPPITPEASDEQALIHTLSETFCGAANNGSLRDTLGWEPERYWQARNRLLESGRVQKAHGGRGGKTVLSPPVGVPVIENEYDGVSTESVRAEEVFGDEAQLYDPMLGQIDSNWIRDEGYDGRITRKTASQGRRDTGGKWTRPDIAVIAIQKFKFLRDPVFDVISFEIKPRWQVTVEGIFEALAHRQHTTRAYAIYHISNSDFEAQREAGRIIALAEQHGVGVLLADMPSDYDSWVERVRARRWNPDPADLNDFIQRVFPASDHDEIIKLAK